MAPKRSLSTEHRELDAPSHAYTLLPTRMMQGSELNWPHELQIALPPSYRNGDRTYPVLWATDASLTFPLAVGTMSILTMGQEAAEAIIVGVGAPASTDASEFNRRRTYEFYPRPRWLNAGVGGQHALRTMQDTLPQDLLDGGGGAEQFLAFLVDELRPQLAREFRFDEADHGLLGASAGGHFATYVLLTRTEAFAKYLIGSPAVSGCEDYLFELEAQHAAHGRQLRGDLFLSAGESEATDAWTAQGDILGSTTRLAQTLRLRDYPELRITCRLFPGHTHYSVLPTAISAGLWHLYAVT